MNTKNELEEILIEYLAIKTALFGSKPDFLKMYCYTHEKRPEDKKNLMQYCSNWKNSKHLKQLYNSTLESVTALKNSFSFNTGSEENGNGEEENGKENEGFFRKGAVNFTDKTQFINYLNNQINLIQDEKQRLDYLKILSDLLRFKEDSNKNTEDIQRFYVPLNCSNCCLYQEKQKELVK